MPSSANSILNSWFESEFPVATYFCSDQHLTLRYPKRGERFARFLELLDPSSDKLVIVGDLCDFWFVARECRKSDIMNEPGLAALKRFIEKKGEVKLLAGNHDQHLEWFYQEKLGLQFQPEPWNFEVAGQKLHLAHGHLLGGRSKWKGLMESPGFLKAFENVPAIVADNLAARLKKYNSRNRKVDNLRHYMVFDRYVRKLQDEEFEPDLIILGHVHQTIFQEIFIENHDATGTDQKRTLAILGHWFEQSSWLKIDKGQADFFIWRDDQPNPEIVTDHRVKRPYE